VPSRFPPLSRRERQIMDVLYRMGRASVADVRAGLSDPPSYSAVRALLRILEKKGHIRHEQDGARYVFIPTVRREAAKRTALRHVINTFFEGSASQVMAALLDMSARDLDDAEVARLRQLINDTKTRRKE
jgi:predicted transcriptional regulator